MTTADLLRSRGVQPSEQRLRVYETLAATKAHPSADAVHRALSPSMPTLSRTTVYSTLALFVERGLARELTITGSELRFDADLSAHAHFACRSCGSVSDLSLPSDGSFAALCGAVAASLPAGYSAQSAELFLSGLCPACAGGAYSDGVGASASGA